MTNRTNHTSRSGQSGPDDPDQMLLRYLDPYLEDRLDRGEREMFEGWLRDHPDVGAMVAELQGGEILRKENDRIRQAVAAENVPSGLASRIRRNVVGGTILPFEPTVGPDGEGTASDDRSDHQSDRRRSFLPYYSIAAALALLVAGWILFGNGEKKDRVIAGNNGTERSDSGRVDTGKSGTDRTNDEAITRILKVGMNDHMKCAVAFCSGDITPYTPEKMKEGLGEEFTPLIPIVQEQVNHGELMVAHRCSFDGRNYVHLVVKTDTTMVSVAITRKKEGESLDGLEGAMMTEGGTSIYQKKIGDYEIAGFESGPFLVFVASDLNPERNLSVIGNLLQPVRSMLRQRESVEISV